MNKHFYFYTLLTVQARGRAGRFISTAWWRPAGVGFPEAECIAALVGLVVDVVIENGDAQSCVSAGLCNLLSLVPAVNTLIFTLKNSFHK